jgi:hypothetical protein
LQSRQKHSLQNRLIINQPLHLSPFGYLNLPYEKGKFKEPKAKINLALVFRI